MNPTKNGDELVFREDLQFLLH